MYIFYILIYQIKMKDIVLFWTPGCGKWTQAKLIVNDFSDKLSHLSTWDVFRALWSSENAIWTYIKSRLETWRLMDDNVTVSLFNVYWFTVLDDKKNMLLDGYPRTMKQFEDLLILSIKHSRDVVWILFDLPEEVTINRMLARGRAWETEEVIRTRLNEYYTQTQPILDAFNKHLKLIKIDWNRSVEEIYEDVKKAIK